MSQPPIFAAVERDIERGWDAFRQHWPHRHYHDPEAAATTPEAPMSLLTAVENEIHTLADHARRIEQEVLPAAVSGAQDIEKLAASNVGQALLAAAHVPASEVDGLLLPVIKWLSDAYAPESVPAAPVGGEPAAGDPAMGQVAEAAPEPAPAAS